MSTPAFEDPFFLDDEAGIAAAAWLRDQLDLFPTTVRWANGGIESSRFKVRADLLRDAVRAASLDDDAGGDFQISVGEKTVRLFAVTGGAEVWISLSRERSDVPVRTFDFGLSRGLLKRLSNVSTGDLDCQIVQGPRGTACDVLKMRLGTARLRLTAEPIEGFPELSNTAVTVSRKFDPHRLQRSLRYALAFVTGPAKAQIVRTQNGLTYAGGPNAVVTVEDTALDGIDLALNAMNARLLARVLGRMKNGESHVWHDDTGYIFEDRLITCRIRRTEGPNMPVAEIRAVGPDASFSLVAEEIWKLATIATLVRPRFVALDFSRATTYEPQNAHPIKVAVRAETPGHPDQFHSVLSAWPQGRVGAAKTMRLSGSAWLAAAAFVEPRSRVEWHLLKRGSILKMIATRQDTTVSMYMPEIADV